MLRIYEVIVGYVPVDGEGNHYEKRKRRISVTTDSADFGCIREAAKAEIDILLYKEFGKGSEGQSPQAVGLEIIGKPKKISDEE